MSSPMYVRAHLPESATIWTDPAHADLLSAVALPGGGMLCVDLLRPNVPIQLHLNAPELDDALQEIVRRYVAADEAGSGPPDVTLPDSWTRLAVVTGVDRWFDRALDEQLLAVDRALALAEFGSAEALAAARALLDDDLRDRLNDFVDELAHGDVGSATSAATEELARMKSVFASLGWAPKWELERAQLSYPPAHAAPSAIPDVDAEFEAMTSGLVVARTFDVDVLHVPARLIGDSVVMAPNDDNGIVVVDGTPFAGIDGNSPAASRLLVRLVDVATGAPLAMSTFVLEPGSETFHGRLSLRGRSIDAVAVDVFDSYSISEPRVRPQDQPRRSALRHAQRAFVAIRQALAAAAAGDDADRVRRLLDEAATHLRDDTLLGIVDYRADIDAALTHLTGGEASSTLPPAAYRPAGPTRPLLAELLAAAR